MQNLTLTEPSRRNCKRELMTRHLGINIKSLEHRLFLRLTYPILKRSHNPKHWYLKCNTNHNPTNSLLPKNTFASSTTNSNINTLDQYTVKKIIRNVTVTEH